MAGRDADVLIENLAGRRWNAGTWDWTSSTRSTRAWSAGSPASGRPVLRRALRLGTLAEAMSGFAHQTGTRTAC